MKAQRKPDGTYSVEGLTTVDAELVRRLGDAEGNEGLLTFVRRLAARQELRVELGREPTPEEIVERCATWRAADGFGM